MRNINYQLQTDRLLETLGDRRPRLLLHCCCGPCSSYVLEYLTKYFDVTVLFYGPNIQPREEYDKRLRNLRVVLSHIPAKVLDCEYEGERFERMAEGLENEPEGGERCRRCFYLRLEETASRAAAEGFDYFCTTLTVSPHKNSQLLNAIGLELAEKYGVSWLPSDFKKRGGFDRSLELSEEFGLYRQEYCGCRFSLDAAREQAARRI